MAAPGKQYGLIFPKKLQQKNIFAPKHSAFAEDSDDETSVGQSLQKEALKKRGMKQTKLEIQRALEEDASVYEYDSIYDDIQKKKEEDTAQLLSGQDRKPKYIQNILQAVEVRKKEQEKRMEKKIQKERELEGDEFKDKEAFVTTAYKKKLQEKAEEEELEKREAELEASLDVTKQKDLSGFYRHLLNQTVGEEKAPECSLRDTGVKEEKPKGYPDEVDNSSKEENIDADSDLGTESSEEEDTADKKPPIKSENLKKGGKTYRKQRQSSSSSEEQNNHKGKDRSKTEASGPDKDKSHQDYGRDWQEEFDERSKYGEHSDKDRHRKREESDSKLRAIEKRELKSSKDGRRDDDRHRKEEFDFYNERERAKGRDRNVKEYRHKEYDDRSEKDFKDRSERPYEHKLDRERGEKMERDYGRRSDRDRLERDNKDRFYNERGERSERQRGERSEREYKERPDRERGERERRERTDRERGERSDREHREKSDPEDIEAKDIKHSEISKKRSSSPSEIPLKIDSKSDATETENVNNTSANKFAKRSNEETVVSARDRYMARQMARVSTKAYVEKEED
ncbi:PREDICTED: nuclear speckle splicing regulatory protein 1 [Nanorana parkeri]|uniref:nuclear speckle splicing regulatory protein 1 n=1 Tax=Nanorana parkeri TaxID=125878 RepID=UPI000854BD9B|nr:PREDICTED: nuclear speckle splicing regulatory protein 1 [Nanorana parkeri]